MGDANELAKRIAADPQWSMLAREVVRWSDALRRPMTARDYSIACNQYERAKRAFDEYSESQS